MKKLNWFQRIYSVEAVGTVVEKHYATKGVYSGFPRRVTVYTFTDAEGEVFRGGLNGEQTIPEVGDLVEMYLGKITFGEVWKKTIRRLDGRVEAVLSSINFKKIRRFRVLEELVDE